MVRVVITGWRTGLDKIALNHLLRKSAGLGLGDAKRSVDQLLTGQPVVVECPDAASADTLCRSAGAVGAICAVDVAVRSG